MTNQVLFIQGGGEDVHDKWDNKIVESLERELGRDYTVRYPRMPDEADPTYAAWKAALKRQFDQLDDGAILIGHSIGGTILIRTLADEPPRLTFAGIFLIAAPFVGDGGWQSEDMEPLSDLGARLSEQTPLYLYHGSKDDTAPFGHVHLYAQAIPQAVVRRLSGRDHQLNNDMSEVAADIRHLIPVRLSSVSPPDTSLDKFFSRYAELSLGPQPEALAGFYAPMFIIGGPQGSQAFTNDVRFVDWLRQVATFNRQHGLRDLTAMSIREVTLSPLHTLATVTWGARFEKTGDRIIEFEISYLLEKAEDEWRILSYVSSSDQTAEMEKEGLL